MMVASTRLAHRVVASVLLATGSVLAGEPTGDAAAQGHAGDVSRVAGVFCASAATNLYGSTGAARGIRTPDPIITNDVLYRLSYCGDGRFLERSGGECNARRSFPPPAGEGQGAGR